jgi:hypothetical protein
MWLSSRTLIVSVGKAFAPQGDGHDRFFVVVDGEVEAARNDPAVERRYMWRDSPTCAEVLGSRAHVHRPLRAWPRHEAC